MAIPADTPALPPPRGPLTSALIHWLTAPAGDVPAGSAASQADPWGDDHQLALYLCYELHYRGFAGVEPELEWEPRLLDLRRSLERAFLDAVRDALGPVASLQDQLDALLTEPLHGSGPSYHLLADGQRWQAREYLAQRSLYHLKEADPQAWVIPRLHGAAQAALVAVEYDEYGAGRADRVHSLLFAQMMADFGLDAAYGYYLPQASAEALAAVNLMSLFGLHRALRGALVGQFAGVEITSSPGSHRLAGALARLGAGPAGTRFYEEHVEADAVHEQLMRHAVIGSLLKEEPQLEADVAFGLAAGTLVDDRLAAHLLTRWSENRSSLIFPLDDGPATAL